jgi:hypothetical protein
VFLEMKVQHGNWFYTVRWAKQWLSLVRQFLLVTVLFHLAAEIDISAVLAYVTTYITSCLYLTTRRHVDTTSAAPSLDQQSVQLVSFRCPFYTCQRLSRYRYLPFQADKLLFLFDKQSTFSLNKYRYNVLMLLCKPYRCSNTNSDLLCS